MPPPLGRRVASPPISGEDASSADSGDDDSAAVSSSLRVGESAYSPAPNPGLSGVPPARLLYAAPAAGALPRLAEEVTALFAHIAAYEADGLLLAAPLRCFIPDYLPAGGEIDVFIKVRARRRRRRQRRWWVVAAVRTRRATPRPALAPLCVRARARSRHDPTASPT